MTRHIVHISTVHSALDGRIFYREAMTLHELGYRVTVCGVHDKDDNIEGIAIRGLKKFPSRIKRLTTSWYRALKVVQSINGDLYQFHDVELLPSAILAKTLLGKRVVFDAHEDTSLFMLKDWLASWLRRPVCAFITRLDSCCARRVDGIVVPTRLLHEKYKRLARRVVTFVNYPAPAFLRERERTWKPFSERQNEIIHLGTLRISRLQFLLSIAKRFLQARPNWSWTFLGMPDAALNWLKRNVPGEIRQRLHAIGKIPHMEVAKRLNQAKIGINYHPLDSRQIRVAIPVKVFEYLSCGLAVITTKVPLLVELVKDCPAVVLTEEHEETYLADLLNLADRKDLSNLSLSARKFGDERFNCRIEAKRLSEFYESIFRDYEKI
ncbi:MAG: glycosyltransferase family 4 protein [Planctomycetes bacterium]|nr:glycosyltransferase family 4 protein [Planctomycetota bacterium]